MMRRFLRTTVVSVLLIWLLVGSVALAQEMGEAGQDCWACHRQPNLAGIEGARTSSALCLDCHGDVTVDESAATSRTALHVDPASHSETLHGQIACVACHRDVSRNPHVAEDAIACEDCHAAILTHVNMGGPHMNTECSACHLADLPVTQDDATGQVFLASVNGNGGPLDRTAHNMVEQTGCDKCHVAGNAVGAPATILPARSILCMVCHDASPTVTVAPLDDTQVRTDVPSLAALLIFGLGIVTNVSLYLRGTIPGHPGLTPMQKLSYIVSDAVHLVFSRRIFRFLGALITEGLFLRRVLRESIGRWVIHGLMYWPFLARLALGLITWLGQLLWPAAEWTQALSDKNTPAVAFAYDFLTLLMLLGVVLALVRRFVLRDRQLVTFSQDKIAIALLGAIFVIGILTEGLRLLSANVPQNLAVYSFLGYAVAALLRPLNLDWTSIYPVLWYLHAVVAVAFIAYLPFSKFTHILAGPLVASLNAARKRSHS
jgi:nitrate reductase gamma subunit